MFGAWSAGFCRVVRGLTAWTERTQQPLRVSRQALGKSERLEPRFVRRVIAVAVSSVCIEVSTRCPAYRVPDDLVRPRRRRISPTMMTLGPSRAAIEALRNVSPARSLTDLRHAGNVRLRVLDAEDLRAAEPRAGAPHRRGRFPSLSGL